MRWHADEMRLRVRFSQVLYQRRLHGLVQRSARWHIGERPPLLCLLGCRQWVDWYWAVSGVMSWHGGWFTHLVPLLPFVNPPVSSLALAVVCGVRVVLIVSTGHSFDRFRGVRRAIELALD
jgi:hypothetical protein